VPAGKPAVSAQALANPEDSAMTPRFDSAQSPLRIGGGGLTSTMDEYLRFAIISPTAENSRASGLLAADYRFLTTDHVPVRGRAAAWPGFRPRKFEVRTSGVDSALRDRSW